MYGEDTDDLDDLDYIESSWMARDPDAEIDAMIAATQQWCDDDSYEYEYKSEVVENNIDEEGEESESETNNKDLTKAKNAIRNFLIEAKRKGNEDELMPIIRRRYLKLKSQELREKYEMFIKEQANRLENWDDLIFVSEKIYNELDWRPYRLIEPNLITFENDDRGVMFGSNFCRIVSIYEYSCLDPWLLVLYANYFIDRFGFDAWYELLNDRSKIFLKKHGVDNLKLDYEYKKIILDDISADDINEADAEFWEQIMHTETHTNKKGFLLRNIPEDIFEKSSVFKSNQKTVWYFLSTYCEKFELTNDDLKMIEIIMNDDCFSDDCFIWTKSLSGGGMHEIESRYFQKYLIAPKSDFDLFKIARDQIDNYVKCSCETKIREILSKTDMGAKEFDRRIGLIKDLLAYEGYAG